MPPIPVVTSLPLPAQELPESDGFATPSSNVFITWHWEEDLLDVQAVPPPPKPGLPVANESLGWDRLGSPAS